MQAIFNKAVEMELNSIQPSDHPEHGSILCSSWPAAKAALSTAQLMIKGFWVRLAITVAMALLQGLVKKFCAGHTDEWYEKSAIRGSNGGL